MVPRVEIDKRSCQSSGNCVSAAPELFAIDSDALAEVCADAPERPLESLLAAARRCPAMAITVFDANGDAIDDGA